MNNTIKNIEELNAQVTTGLTIVDFYADWCGPCKELSPTLEKLKARNENLKVVKVNVDEARDLATNFNIRGIPTLLFYKDGEVKSTATGNLPEAELQNRLNQMA